MAGGRRAEIRSSSSQGTGASRWQHGSPCRRASWPVSGWVSYRESAVNVSQSRGPSCDVPLGILGFCSSQRREVRRETSRLSEPSERYQPHLVGRLSGTNSGKYWRMVIAFPQQLINELASRGWGKTLGSKGPGDWLPFLTTLCSLTA